MLQSSYHCCVYTPWWNISNLVSLSLILHFFIVTSSPNTNTAHWFLDVQNQKFHGGYVFAIYKDYFYFWIILDSSFNTATNIDKPIDTLVFMENKRIFSANWVRRQILFQLAFINPIYNIKRFSLRMEFCVLLAFYTFCLEHFT